MLRSAFTGKISIIQRKVANEFSEEYNSTIGAMCIDVRVALDESEVSLSFWDTSRTEKYESIAPYYLCDSQAIVLVFDITRLQKFTEQAGWTNLAREICPTAHLFLSQTRSI
jgi:GTPase SAR1 family protein